MDTKEKNIDLSYKIYRNFLNEMGRNYSILLEKHSGFDLPLKSYYQQIDYALIHLMFPEIIEMNETQENYYEILALFDYVNNKEVLKKMQIVFECISEESSKAHEVSRTYFVGYFLFYVNNLANQYRSSLGLDKNSDVFQQVVFMYKTLSDILPDYPKHDIELVINKLIVDKDLHNRLYYNAESKLFKTNYMSMKTINSYRLKQKVHELNALIGLNDIKSEINTLINLIYVNSIKESYGINAYKSSYHMIFTGHPGTGKTTVARLLSKIFHELGLLSKGHLVEVDRSNLVAGYIGQTAINVRNVIESALGGILFIDEAYSLSRDSQMSDFGHEAIETLVKQMEDSRDDLVVIIAGYPQEMKKFVNSNPGLRSRFNISFNFPNFSVLEMVEIFNLFCVKNNLTCEEGFFEHIFSIFSMYTDLYETEGNARWVRKLFETSLRNQANRLAVDGNFKREDVEMLKIEDFPLSYIIYN